MERMKTTALRLYGKNDLRLETFDLPDIKDNEVLADVVTDSVCMSTHKAVLQGADHKRVPGNVSSMPIIVGHEQCGTILKVGDALRDKFQVGMKYSLQPAVNYPGREIEAVGYSYPYVGGDATKVIIPADVIEMDCLIPYSGDSFFNASLSEPISCILGALKSQYHGKPKEYAHEMGIKDRGRLALLGGAGPMGLGFIDLLLNGDRKPGLLVVTDIDDIKLHRAEKLFPREEAAQKGVTLEFMDSSRADALRNLMTLTENKGFDDIFVMVPVSSVAEQASQLLGYDGCLNVFAGATDKSFGALVNLYHVHYNHHHIMGSTGGDSDDMRQALDLIGRGVINPAVMITHIGGLDSAADTIKNLPNIPGGKKLIYTGISLALTALEDFSANAKADPLFERLGLIIQKTKGLWSKEAEEFLLANAKPIH
jgi:threonine dehydrogenase-like Zn-dependent dehydrogenase